MHPPLRVPSPAMRLSTKTHDFRSLALELGALFKGHAAATASLRRHLHALTVPPQAGFDRASLPRIKFPPHHS